MQLPTTHNTPSKMPHSSRSYRRKSCNGKAVAIAAQLNSEVAALEVLTNCQSTKPQPLPTRESIASLQQIVREATESKQQLPVKSVWGDIAAHPVPPAFIRRAATPCSSGTDSPASSSSSSSSSLSGDYEVFCLKCGNGCHFTRLQSGLYCESCVILHARVDFCRYCLEPTPFRVKDVVKASGHPYCCLPCASIVYQLQRERPWSSGSGGGSSVIMGGDVLKAPYTCYPIPTDGFQRSSDVGVILDASV
jgi:hypothetical protein